MFSFGGDPIQILYSDSGKWKGNGVYRMPALGNMSSDCEAIPSCKPLHIMDGYGWNDEIILPKLQ